MAFVPVDRPGYNEPNAPPPANWADLIWQRIFYCADRHGLDVSLRNYILTPGWTTTAISLVADNRHGFFPGPDTYAGASSSSAGASPGDASTDGGKFTVTWSSSDAATG